MRSSRPYSTTPCRRSWPRPRELCTGWASARATPRSAERRARVPASARSELAELLEEPAGRWAALPLVLAPRLGGSVGPLGGGGEPKERDLSAEDAWGAIRPARSPCPHAPPRCRGAQCTGAPWCPEHPPAAGDSVGL